MIRAALRLRFSSFVRRSAFRGSFSRSAYSCRPARVDGRDEALLSELRAARGRADWVEAERVASIAAVEAPRALEAWVWSSIESARELVAGRRELFGDPRPVIAAELLAVDVALSALNARAEERERCAEGFGSRTPCGWILALQERAVAEFGETRLPRTTAILEARTLRAIAAAAAAQTRGLARPSLATGFVRLPAAGTLASSLRRLFHFARR
ncbi:hypothetical protein LA345_13320 [Burkholderia vietnamiensis]|uniref:Uncharacterized protein n=1 Tax=Burkholderia vietnamiensis (strain G4 / LMG 22486) TaxID=269482 RepID=A4JFT5_BURVG|nr:hypothetical protein Bcep1808_2136 [Burkholderia vietnamiensis G4]MCB4344894.1 hypothetical protein [Burkholderia vietnamiensis]